jgi:hypothetical protein
MWETLAPHPKEDAMCITVLDVTGIQWNSLMGDSLEFIKAVAHYRYRWCSHPQNMDNFQYKALV